MQGPKEIGDVDTEDDKDEETQYEQWKARELARIRCVEYPSTLSSSIHCISGTRSTFCTTRKTACIYMRAKKWVDTASNSGGLACIACPDILFHPLGKEACRV